jgi:HK97 family phage portal protein
MAGLFGAIARGVSAPAVTKGGAVPSYGMIPPLGSVQSASGLLISQATAMTVSSVYRAVTVKARDVARCTPSLYRVDSTGTRITVQDHAVAKLLIKPNRQQPWFDFCRDLMIGVYLRGNGYAAIIRDRRGDPIELIGINPDAVMVLEASDGSVFYNVNRLGLWQIAMLQNFPVAIPQEDIFHVRGPSFNTLVGASTIGLSRDSIGLAMGQNQQMSRWIGNGARPSGLLKSKKLLGDEAAKRLKQQWNDYSSGIQNVGRTAVLEDGVEFQPLQLDSVDLQMIEQANFSVQDIARFFGMPTRKLMQPDTTKGSTIIQEEQDYVNTEIAPELSMLEGRLGFTFDLPDQELKVDMSAESLLRADILTRRNADRLGILSGTLTQNEARRSEGRPPIAGGDVLLIPSNTAAQGSDVTGTAGDGAGRPDGQNLPKPGAPTGGVQPSAGDDY